MMLAPSVFCFCFCFLIFLLGCRRVIVKTAKAKAVEEAVIGYLIFSFVLLFLSIDSLWLIVAHLLVVF